jgi:hypothetical protein
MKENQNIEELLNSFIDGELTDRQQTEVQRLISHDTQIEKRLRELEKCKLLVGSLPHAEAPAGMLEEITASVERRTLFGGPVERFDEREGARHLLFRRVLAAAAMIALVAVMGGVIYTIIAPESGPKQPVIAKDWPEPVKGFEVTVVEKPIAETGPAERGFSGRLELKTDALVAVNSYISKAIEDNGLLVETNPDAEEDESIYFLSCSREGLGLFLNDLGYAWSRFDSATLFVETAEVGRQVAVDEVSAEQVDEIVNQDSFNRRVKVAKDFAVLNSIAKLVPGKEVLAAIDGGRGDLITIPKPVLTSNEKATEKPAGQTRGGEVHLTIVVAGSE